MKKVVHVILGKANPNRMNGVNKVVNSLATTQSGLGFPVEVWGLTKSPLHNYPPRNYITKLYLDHSKFKIADNLKKDIILEMGNGSIFHFHGAFIYQFSRMAKMIRKAGLKYVINLHGGYNRVALERSKLKKIVYHWLVDRKYLNHAKFIQIIGKSEIEGLLDYKIKTKVILIPNGQNKIRSVVGESNHLQFVYCGRIDVKTKGLDILFNGFALSLRNGLKANLKIIGDGGDLMQLKQLANKLEITDEVEFCGALYGDDKWEVISNSTALILASRNEGLPGVVLESLGLNIPVIVSEETNVKEGILLYNCGYVLPENTALNLMYAINQMSYSINNGQYQQLSSNCSNAINNHFSWVKIASELRINYADAS